MWTRMAGLTRRALAAGLASVAGACSVPTLFNTLAPRDAGGRRVATSVPYRPGPRHTADVYAPTAERPAGGWPLLVFIYGGSWASGDKSIYPFVGTSFAANGFVTVIPDYRLVPEVRFPAFVEDCAAAVAWALANAARYGADPNRLVLLGHSAGAYNAITLTLDRRFLQAAGVDPERVRAAAGLSGPYDFYPFDVDASRNAFGQYPDPRMTQPINLVRPDAPPLFLATGLNDDTVQPRNTLALAQAERAVGGRVEVKTYPGLDHTGAVLAISRPFRGRAPVLRDVLAFYRGVLGPGA